MISRLVIRRNNFVNNVGDPLAGAGLGALPNFSENTATGNAAGNFFAAGGQSLTGLGKLEIGPEQFPGPVLVCGGLIASCGTGDELTFNVGVILKSRRGISLTVNTGQLHLLGRPANPVVTTRLDDDAFGGDTTNNGTGAAGIAWSGIFVRSRAETSTIEHAILRRANVGVSCQSGKLTLRNTRVEVFSNRTTFSLSRLAGHADNLVVIGARAAFAIGSSTATFDLRHATVASCATGIIAGSSWPGAVRNSNFFGQTTANFGSGITTAKVFNTNGGFAGQNGALNVDPQFRDLPNRGVHLKVTSPIADRGDLGTGLAAGQGHLGFPRVLTGPTDGFAPDMGAFEFAETGIKVAGEPNIGETRTIPNWGNPLAATLLLGVFDGTLPIPGIGTILIGRTIIDIGAIPTTGQPLALPNDPALVGATFGAQCGTVSLANKLALTDFRKLTIGR